MGKKHLKRIAMPRTWQIKRKGIKFITRPNPGAHKLADGMPINLILKNIIGLTTTKEVRSIMNSGDVLVDGKPRKDVKHMTGLFDVLSFPKIKKYYRITLNPNNKIDFVEIDNKDAGIKPCKIISKTIMKGGKVQLKLSGGRTFTLEKNDYKTGDTLILGLPNQDLKEHIPLDKGNLIFLSGGKHVGTMGNITNIEGRKITFKSADGKDYETLKRFAFVIGKKTSSIKI